MSLKFKGNKSIKETVQEMTSIKTQLAKRKMNELESLPAVRAKIVPFKRNLEKLKEKESAKLKKISDCS